MKNKNLLLTSTLALMLAGGSLLVLAPSAKGQGAETSSAQGGSSIADLLSSLDSRSRDSHSTFDNTVSYDGDLDIGRRSMFLEGHLEGGIDGEVFQLVATADDEMDIRSITLIPRGTGVQLLFLGDYVLGGPELFARLSGLHYVEEGDSVATYYPDPPIRFREGDAIFILAERQSSIGNAFAGLTLRGTAPVPSAGSGDLLRVE